PSSGAHDPRRLPCGVPLLPHPRPVRAFFFYPVHISAGGKKATEPLGVAAPAARLTSCLMRVDWPAQPYRNLAQRLFQSYFIKCFRRVSPIGIGRTSWRTEAGGTCRVRVVPRRVS